MRIIAGTAKGRRLDSPKGFATRPTADRVREAVFSTLQAKTQGSAILDVFAGTGAMALEALSRGAKEACLIEKSYEAMRVISANIKKCGFDNAYAYHGDCLRILPQLKSRFDIVFLDPPYASEILQLSLRVILESRLLCDRAVLVIETSADCSPSFLELPLEIIHQSSYGDTMVSYCSELEVR